VIFTNAEKYTLPKLATVVMPLFLAMALQRKRR